jgi:hypothetical protein
MFKVQGLHRVEKVEKQNSPLEGGQGDVLSFKFKVQCSKFRV